MNKKQTAVLANCLGDIHQVAARSGADYVAVTRAIRKMSDQDVAAVASYGCYPTTRDAFVRAVCQYTWEAYIAPSFTPPVTKEVAPSRIVAFTGRSGLREWARRGASA